jgi:hypothetical protein
MHMCLPPSLQSNEEVPGTLRVFEGLAELVEGAEAEIQICDHFGVARVWLAGFAGLVGHEWGAGDGDEEEHQCGAEDYRHDLVIHSAEGVVFFVDVEEPGDRCC